MPRTANFTPTLEINVSATERRNPEHEIAKLRHNRLAQARTELALQQEQLIARNREISREIKVLSQLVKSLAAQELSYQATEGSAAGLVARAKANRLAQSARLLNLKARRAEGVRLLGLVQKQLAQFTEQMRESRRQMSVLMSERTHRPALIPSTGHNGAASGTLVASLTLSAPRQDARAIARARQLAGQV